MSRRKFRVISLLFLGVISSLFYVGEFDPKDLHFFVKCSPPEKLDCKNANLHDRNLVGTNLRNANFEGATLVGTDLRGADLNGANLQGAKMFGANMEGANLTNSNLQNAELFVANLQRANLKDANLKNADLSEANLQGANLQGANVTGTDFRKADLTNTDVTGVTGKLSTISVPKTESTGSAPSSSKPISKVKAESLLCRDGKVLAYCQVRWSDGSYRALPMSIGSRQGGVVDSIIYYDLQDNPTCIQLYADGSIMTSYDTDKCF
jgi:hypothetical protein